VLLADIAAVLAIVEIEYLLRRSFKKGSDINIQLFCNFL
jgi:hypothetical protein